MHSAVGDLKMLMQVDKLDRQAILKLRGSMIDRSLSNLIAKYI